MVEISEFDVNDDETIGQLLDLARAVHAADAPDNPGPCSVAFPVGYRKPWPGSDVHRRVVRADGRIVAELSVGLPNLDNFHLADIWGHVHPSYRRRGIGRALMEAGFDIARKDNRRTLNSGTRGRWNDGPERPDAGQRFLDEMGFKLALTEVQRRTDLTALDPQVEQRLYDEALAKSQDYETIAWSGRSPEELLEGQAKLDSIFVEEAPMGDLDVEPENVDADRARKGQESAIARGIFMVGVTARHILTGEIVADTMIGVRTEPGDHADQWGTLVGPGHRGRRLGMRIKIENHRQLRKHRPKVRWVSTENADVNDQMIAINEALGFRTVDASLDYQRSL